ncbi:MAG: hypothetical protein PHG44_02515 [Lentisphaeria bacterium]|jgi:Flp pilus assembly CpaF family ATPase|nr:hypothetical protein [Lentisphaeria bacterium]MDY0175479.1 hypothetical protein [Lentisphaeria bacterium]NLZ59946.1 hypothetical protein [Lentisphaerota bacterium]
MKIFVLLLFCLGVFTACEPAKPASQGGTATKSAAQPKPATKKTAAENQKKSGSGQSLRQEVMSAVDYGIGATQLRAKKSATEKIDKISGQHNKDLEDALK